MTSPEVTPGFTVPAATARRVSSARASWIRKGGRGVAFAHRQEREIYLAAALMPFIGPAAAGPIIIAALMPPHGARLAADSQERSMNDADDPVLARSVPQRRLSSDPGLGQRLSRELAEVRSQLEQSARPAARLAADRPLADRQRPAQPSVPPHRRTASDAARRHSASGHRAQLLVALLALTAIVLGGLHAVSSARDVLAFGRTQRLAGLSAAATTLAGQLENERDQSVLYIAGGRPPALLARTTRQYAVARPWVAQARSQAGRVGSAFPVQARRDAAAVTRALRGLPALRRQSVGAGAVPGVVQGYAVTIDALIALDDDIAPSSGDPALASSVHALSVISAIAEQASEQRAYLAAALIEGTFGPGLLAGLVTARAQLSAAVPAFISAATPEQAALYSATVAGPPARQAGADETQAIALGDRFADIGNQLANSGIGVRQWLTASSAEIRDLRTVERAVLAAARTRAGDLRRDAVADSIICALAVILAAGLGLTLARPRWGVRPASGAAGMTARSPG
jgi:hypothetical protein